MTTFLDIENYIMQKPSVTYDYPFDDKTRVYRIVGKIFALTQDRDPLSINLKCDPEYGLSLKLMYRGILEGYHMNKKHWNTVMVESDVPTPLLWTMINHSYEMVFNNLPRKVRDSW